MNGAAFASAPWKRLLPPDGRPLIDRAEHASTYGPLPSARRRVAAGPSHPLIEAVSRAGLTGRGGAGFPTATKLHAVASRRGPKCVLVNATESEPYARKDQILCGLAPHLVLDGAEVSAAAVGADEVVVVAHKNAHAPLLSAAEQRTGRDRPSFTVIVSPGFFVSGEETALVDLANGGEGLPKTKPPRPFELGVGGRSTLVVNAETAANVALIWRHGPDWLRGAGTLEEPGRLLFTITGAVAEPGVYEAPIGTSITELLTLAKSPEVAAFPLLAGGFFGAFLPADCGSVRFSRAGLSPYGAATGAGILYALGPQRCGLTEASRIVTYLAGQSAGQCGPCRFGLAAVATELSAVVSGGTRANPAKIERFIGQIVGRGACAHPDGTSNLVMSALRVFGEEAARHARGDCVASASGVAVRR